MRDLRLGGFSDRAITCDCLQSSAIICEPGSSISPTRRRVLLRAVCHLATRIDNKLNSYYHLAISEDRIYTKIKVINCYSMIIIIIMQFRGITLCLNALINLQI